MYLVQWLDYLNYEDWIEKQFEHMTIAFKMHHKVHCSHLETSIVMKQEDFIRV
jgi:hypothetical protein